MAEDVRIIGEVRNRVDKAQLRSDGIIQITVFGGAEYTLADAKQGIASVSQLSQGRRYPMLVDLRNIKAMDRATRKELAAWKGGTSVAVLIASPVSRVIGNFFITFNKPLIPFRLFSSEEEAIKWLRGFLE